MRFEVPQFIEIEDKIIGPFTWRQFVYVAGGGGAVVLLYLWNLPTVLFLLVAFPIAGLAGALAFYPVNNRPFSLFLESVFNYIFSKKLYLWRRKNNTVYSGDGVGLPGSAVLNPDPNKTNLASLSRKLELNEIDPAIDQKLAEGAIDSAHKKAQVGEMIQ